MILLKFSIRENAINGFIGISSGDDNYVVLILRISDNVERNGDVD